MDVFIYHFFNRQIPICLQLTCQFVHVFCNKCESSSAGISLKVTCPVGCPFCFDQTVALNEVRVKRIALRHQSPSCSACRAICCAPVFLGTLFVRSRTVSRSFYQCVSWFSCKLSCVNSSHWSLSCLRVFRGEYVCRRLRGEE